MTNPQDAAEEFIRNEQDTSHQARLTANQLNDELLAAATATPWGQAFIQWRAQQFLAQRLQSEVNRALTSQGRQQQYVPPLHDANLWLRIEESLSRAADDLATTLVDIWRDEQARYESGDRDSAPEWPTAKDTPRPKDTP